MGTVYVLTPDLTNAVGGVRMHYRLVDTLVAAGIPAAIVHKEEGFRCRWFENDTPVVCARLTTATQDDLIVFPEELVGLVPKLAPGVPKLVYNQNAYTTFLWGLSEAETSAAYHHPDVLATTVVSEDNLLYLRSAFPDIRVERVRYAIDSGLYHPRGNRRRAVSYMPRKRKLECDELLALLRASQLLEGWEVLTIDGVSEHRAAEMLSESSVFLSFSLREGFGLPPAEAMASGCLVVGFDGFGGKEFFGDHSIPVADGDVQSYFSAVSDVLRTWDARREHFETMAQRGADFVNRAYSSDAHRASVVPLFRELMSAPRKGSAQGPLELPLLGRERWDAAKQQVRSALHAASRRRSIADSTKHFGAALSVLMRGF